MVVLWAALDASPGIQLPSARTMLVLAPLVLLVVGLQIGCLVDLVRSPTVRYLPRAAWVLIVVAVSPPFGAAAYLGWGRERHDGQALGLSAEEIAEVRGVEEAERRAVR
jgi:hypothetical protein